MVTVVLDATDSVVTVKVAEDVPDATVTETGTVAAAVLDEDSVTEAPAGGARPVRVAVPVTVLPPTTLVGETVTLVRAAGVTVSDAVFVTPE